MSNPRKSYGYYAGKIVASATFDGTGGAITAATSAGLTGITKSATGVYAPAFDVTLPNANYIVGVTVNRANTLVAVTAQSTVGFTVTLTDQVLGAAVDVSGVTVAATMI